ncbi:sulfurtransferase [Nocardia higoensis]|uniref:Sulfurtransferase n=1 Tax=Nocardia higoensis TaxID=228599 RepID=A0ABS0D6L1_9NOCA|nr:sulfurtransferase [Nocardia higoensis]MBF6353433.1 sulfurtransferase [Nocardia higoensis]
MTIITATELADLLAGDAPVRLLDVRWTLTRPDGREAFADGHIPGAVYVDLETELSDHSVTGRGRHPLPSGRDLQAALRRWGIDDGDTVVAYDDWNRAGSARAWWVLRAAGLTDVRILDGGLAGWLAAGGSVQYGRAAERTGSVTVAHDDLYAGALPVLTAAEAARIAGSGVLLDARAPERFRGELEPVDPIAGHIPGSVNLPSTRVLHEDGGFVEPEKLRERFARRGVNGATPLGAYCGSGVTAAVLVAAAASAGIEVALFPGSWSQWSSDPANPVATGE